ncbi:MAG: hypothetical protein KatS3mg109_1900 [Pirellulaceae bacterium]|nr:MAG: hypothetical protein KatS3mg109_1900 [Pirellulaceae bacterium]
MDWLSLLRVPRELAAIASVSTAISTNRLSLFRRPPALKPILRKPLSVVRKSYPHFQMGPAGELLPQLRAYPKTGSRAYR